MNIEKFWELIRLFDLETGWSSGMGADTFSYQSLKRMGPEIVPLLCQALLRGCDWRIVCLINEFVSDPPVIDKEDAGIVPNVVKAWINWGINKKYLP